MTGLECPSGLILMLRLCPYDEMLIIVLASQPGLGGSGRKGDRPATQGNLIDVPVEEDTMQELVNEKKLLHGTLEVHIRNARNLPNMDVFSEKFRQLFSCVTVCKTAMVKTEEKAHHHRPKGITSDPYAAVNLAGARVARTRVISNETNPTWNEHFSIPVAHYVDNVKITVKDNDMLGAQLIGEVIVPVEKILDGEPVEGWHDVIAPSGKIAHGDAAIFFRMKFTPVERNPIYLKGVGDHGVPNTYFPDRKGCRVTMYQDAHIMDGSLPEITLEDGVKFHHRQAWEEICQAILDAHHLIYIAGWSINTKVKLLRDTTQEIPEGGDLILGELLKRKSAEGVRVLMLVWDDKTSHNNIIKTVYTWGPCVHANAGKKRKFTVWNLLYQFLKSGFRYIYCWKALSCGEVVVLQWLGLAVKSFPTVGTF